MEYYAHSVEGKPPSQWQYLEEHLGGSSEKSAMFADAFSSSEWGRLAGLWHDVGKYQESFQKKLLGTNVKVEHSGPGAALACEKLRDRGIPLAFAISGHHTGLANWIISEHNQPVPLKERLKENEMVLKSILPDVPPMLQMIQPPELPLFLKSPSKVDKERLWRSYELWVRFLFSALVDADRLDTEAFLKPDLYKRRAGSQQLSELRKLLDGYVDGKVANLPEEALNSKVNTARRYVLTRCREASKSPSGLFSLTVPTGGGKTLSSMSFALNHAEHNNLRRVFAVIPYTSIIEQNAAEYKQALGYENVIEHHSAFGLEGSQAEPDEEARSRQTLATENWDAPVIVTTSVQFFETLLSAHPSRCRKLHNVARSVIILDEVQTLPPGLLSPILEVIQELVANYGCSVVLSTATLPALAARPSLPQGLQDIKPIIPDPDRLTKELKRVDYSWPLPDTVTSWGELANELSREKRVLVVVHRRQDARDLASAVINLTGGASVFHLSALMCPAHRLDVIKQIKRVLAEGSPCRVIATQLVEAGVDFDFPIVYRALGGLDSIVQAAGRCNREARLERGKLIVFRAPTAAPPGTPRRGLEIMENMLNARAIDPDSPASIENYFRELYFAEDLDAQNIQRERQSLNFATVGQNFRLIEDGFTKSVVVPYGKAPGILKKLRKEGPSREVYRALQRYTVSIYPDAFQRLWDSGALLKGEGEIFCIAPGFERLYDNTFGLAVGDVPPIDPQASVI